MELWDLYTKDRVKTSKTMIRGNEVPNGLFHLVVHVCIFNSDGELLIQQRQSFKQGWPNKWDITVGGSAISNDSSSSAAHRELYEELGLDLSFENLRPSLTIHFEEGFDDFYLINQDVKLDQLKLQYEEVQYVKWANLDEILVMIDNKEFIPYHKSLIELLFNMRNYLGAHYSG